MENYLPNEVLHNEFHFIKKENYQLRQKLNRKTNEIKGKDKYILKLEKQLREYEKKNRYKNLNRGTIYGG
jgi:hypothetical protein